MNLLKVNRVILVMNILIGILTPLLVNIDTLAALNGWNTQDMFKNLNLVFF